MPAGDVAQMPAPSRQWTTAIGTIAYAGELPPEYGIPFANRLDAETDRIWLKAHQAASESCEGVLGLAPSTVGTADGDEASSGAVSSGTGAARSAKAEIRRSALAAQAFVRMMENGGGKGKSTRADLVIVCDLQAYRRGHAHDGEACHIVGGGPTRS